MGARAAKPDHYQRLGVPVTATAAQIRAAYRALARKLHPDVNAAPDAAARFSEIQQAYEVLSDAARRRRYDKDRERRVAAPAADAAQAHYSWSNIADAKGRVGARSTEDFDEIYSAFFETRARQQRAHKRAGGKATGAE